ncbi:MAG: ribulose-phosphate 3-epimerase [bacterium]
MVIERKVLPSLLSAPFDRLGEAVRALEAAGCRLLHYDVMDGHFVPNLTIGPLIISSLAPHTASEFDVHPMVTNPEVVYPWFLLDRVRSITIHGEATPNLHALLMKIRAEGKLAGVSLNPATPIDSLVYVLPYLDLVQVMTVNPGFGGQSFLPEIIPKIRALRALRDEKQAEFIIQVDGGINTETLDTVLQSGAEEIVAGNAIFGASDPVSAYLDFDRRVRQAG